MKELLDNLQKSSTKPSLFEPGEPRFWDDPYISRSMLSAHLDSNHDGASRQELTIDKTVEYWLSSGLLKPGLRVLDLGCGPGLYAQRLSKAGIHVVGLDISQRSLDYAAQRAKEAGLEIEYLCMNFLDMNYQEEFDVILQVYGELCVFPDEKRDLLLKKIGEALKPDGLFIFDVSTRALRKRAGLKNRWYVGNGGFWRPGKHLVLEQGFDYPEADTWLDQYIVMDEYGSKVYRNWFHDYSWESIQAVLQSSGFEVKKVWNDLGGAPFSKDGDWIGIAAEKR